jgi:hypothetical protein
METISFFALGKPISDKATGIKGRATHIQLSANLEPYYLFQPHGINPETGQPVRSQWIEETRVVDGIRKEYEVPIDIIGSSVTDVASGLTGVVTHITIHIGGCVHCLVQPQGTLKKTGDMIDAVDVNIRLLEGEMVPKFTDDEFEADKKKKPSPAPVPKLTPHHR